MEGAEQPVDPRRVRRAVRAIRIVFYSCVLLIGVPMVATAMDRDDPYTTLTGRTSQGHAVELDLEDERPTFIRTVIDARCPWEEPWRVEWARRIDGELRTHHRTADRGYDHGWTGDRRVTVDVRVGDGEVTGRLSLVEDLRDASGRYYRCDSGVVTFSAARAD